MSTEILINLEEKKMNSDEVVLPPIQNMPVSQMGGQDIYSVIHSNLSQGFWERRSEQEKKTMLSYLGPAL